MHSQNPRSKTCVLLRDLHLPREIVEEIVSRLPVKSLLRFRCVSKSWLSLIKSNRFIDKHLKNSTENTSLAHHWVAYKVRGSKMKVCSLQSLLTSKEVSSSSSSIDIDIINNPTNKKDARLVGCCNGVFCLLLSCDGYLETSFALWNPATRALIELPKLSGLSLCLKYGFGWDESSGAFKVFACSSSSSKSRSRSGHVYSSKTNSWKTVPSAGCGSTVRPFGVFVGGRVHWAIWCCSNEQDHLILESFNLESDEFGRIELPPPFNTSANANATESFGLREVCLGEIRGCLCTLFEYKKNGVDVWVMKEYGVKDSWFKLLNFPIFEPRFCFCNFPLFGEGLDGEIFIIYRNTFVVCPSIGKAKASSIATNNNITRYRASIYVETLASPINPS